MKEQKKLQIFRKECRKTNFTLIELLIVVAIIAILAAMVLPALNTALAKAQTITCAHQIKGIHTAVSLYADSFEGFTPQYKSNKLLDDRTANWGAILIYAGLLKGIDISCPGAGAMGANLHSECRTLTRDYLINYFKTYNGEWQTTYGGYGMNYKMIDTDTATRPRMSSIKNPSIKILIGDSGKLNDGDLVGSCGIGPYNLGPGSLYGWHNTTANVLFWDGHVKGYRGPSSDPETFFTWTKSQKELYSWTWTPSATCPWWLAGY